MGLREELTGVANRISARTALRISAVALALELSIAVTTFLPGAPLVPQGLPFLLFPGVFVVQRTEVWLVFSVYLHAVVLEQRIFTLIPAVFYALGVLVNIALIGDHRAQPDSAVAQRA
jgi:hypothetical protein